MRSSTGATALVSASAPEGAASIRWTVDCLTGTVCSPLTSGAGDASAALSRGARIEPRRAVVGETGRLEAGAATLARQSALTAAGLSETPRRRAEAATAAL